MTDRARPHGYLYDEAERRNSMILIERMEREGASTREIERAMRETVGNGPPTRSSNRRRPRRALALLRRD
jgi:hypothetical protein